MFEYATKTPSEQWISSTPLEPMLNGRQRLRYQVAIAIWFGLTAFFWVWWFQRMHIVGLGRYVVVTLVLFWIYFLQAYFLLMFLRARKSVAALSELGEYRVAMIVTKTPSEPFEIVRETLIAMLGQDVEHDTWLADEDPSPETAQWCYENGVKISTRKGCEDYHRKVWPRRTRCKEGNLAYFYDHYGYESYDYVVQMDADHVPQANYLREMLRPFSDQSVGYVSAPSICSSNAEQSWAARARLYAEAMFHGVLQAGYSGGWAPMCIGSHYAVRTVALKDVGGLGPDLAEDHSTTMIMNAGGWRGVHAIDAIAFGAGPASIADLVTQEFQWSRSLVTLLLQHTSNYFRNLTPRLRFQFVFSQMWYPLFAVFMAVVYALPIVALGFDFRYADVTYPAFIAHAAPATIALIFIAFMIRRDGLFRPIDAKIVSWEKVFFVLAQWPWVLWGSLMAVWDKVSGKFVDFRITPKGDAAQSRLPARVIAPYAVLAAVALFPILTVDDVQDAKGFYILGLVNAVLYVSLFTVIIVAHLKTSAKSFWLAGLPSQFQVAVAVGLLLISVTATWLRGPESLLALTIGLEPLQIIETQFVVAGAGAADPGTTVYLFAPKWN